MTQKINKSALIHKRNVKLAINIMLRFSTIQKMILRSLTAVCVCVLVVLMCA